MKRKKKKGINPSGMRCPYCGKPLILRSADGIYHENPKNTMLYVCKDYPQCDTGRNAGQSGTARSAQ